MATHLLEVCSSYCGASHLDGDRFFQELCRLAGVASADGGTSADGVIKLQRVECLDVCDAGPILRIDGTTVYKQISVEDAGSLIERLRRGREPG